jgi:hypothetical protein
MTSPAGFVQPRLLFFKTRPHGTSSCAFSYISDRKGGATHFERTNKMTRTRNLAKVAGIALAFVALAGCRTSHTGIEGSFDRRFTVSGPVTLELNNGSGDTRITTGPPGEVRIHGEFQVDSWSKQGGERQLQELESNPPVSQRGNLIHIGDASHRGSHDSVDYTIVVPSDAELRSTAGSGDVDVSGILGPANFTSGSGAVKASGIAGDVQTQTGSGDIELSDIKGHVQIATGSGDITLDAIHGDTRIRTGSGDIEMSHPGGALEADTGSGDIIVKDASRDLRLRASSGDITVDGNPASSNFWDIHTNSGEVVLDVPQSASFRLYAHSSSGDIDAAIPIVMEGTAAKHELRARIGDAKARVEIETSSGGISLH